MADAASRFRADGFYFPLDVLSEGEAADALAAFRRHDVLSRRAGGPLAAHRSYPKMHLLAPWVDRIVRHPRLLDAVERVLGPNILVWSTQMFVRQAHSSMTLAWHQDAVYYGLQGIEERGVRVWLALTPAVRENGTMRFARGTHVAGVRPHGFRDKQVETLMRGEEVLVDIDPATEVEVVLKAGQASMHSMLIAHASGANSTDQDRVNLAIDFLSPEVVPVGTPDSALLVRGEDHLGHFGPESPPTVEFGPLEIQHFLSATQLRMSRLRAGLEHGRSSSSALVPR